MMKQDIQIDDTIVRIKKSIYLLILDNSAFIVLILLLLSGLLSIFIYLYPFDVLEVHSPYKVLTPTVRAGDNLQYQVDSVKKLDFPSDMACYFEDGVIYKLPQMYSNDKMGHNNFVIEMVVPATLQPSEYRLHCEINYHITTIKTVHYEYYTEYFQVIK